MVTVDHRIRLQPFVAAIGIALLVGCGNKPSTVPARGKVSFPDGRPLAGAIVTLRSVGGDRSVTSRGYTQPDGSFELTTIRPKDGAVVGKHQALVVVPVVESNGPFARPPLDPRFSDYSTSGFEFTVTDNPEQNQFEIVVTPPRER